MLLFCYQNSGFGFAVKMTPTGYFFQNCHDFLAGTGAMGSGVGGSLDSINMCPHQIPPGSRKTSGHFLLFELALHQAGS